MRGLAVVAALSGVGFAGCPDERSSSSEPGSGAQANPPSPASDSSKQSLVESVVAIDGGGDSTCALLDDGQVACWGSFGECDGPALLCQPAARPILLPGKARLKEISGGGSSWWGVGQDGALFRWGWRIDPMGVRSGFRDPTAAVLAEDPKYEPPGVVAAQEPGWVLRDDEGLHSIRPLRFGIAGVKRLAHGCVIDEGGRKLCLYRGRHESGWLGPLPTEFSEWPTAASVRPVACRIRDQEMRCDYFAARSGFGGEPEASAIASLPRAAKRLYIGSFTMCADLGDGDVACAPVWDLRKGAFAMGTVRFEAEVREPGAVRDLQIGEGDVCAILESGLVKCWWPPDPFKRRGPTSGEDDDPRRGVRDVAGLEGAVSLAGGSQHMCALVGGGGVRCWGMDEKGQLGDGDPLEYSKTPTHVLAARPLAAVR